jgi:hypothetical protein
MTITRSAIANFGAPSNQRYSTTTAPASAESPLEREARAAAQKAYDEVKGQGRAGYSSGHSRTAGAAVSAHAAERQKTIDAAVSSHRIPESRRSHYAGLYDRDPAGTKTLLASLTPVPTVLARQPATSGRLSAAAAAGSAPDATGFSADDPLPPGLSLLTGSQWTDHASRMRERQELEGFAATTSQESLVTEKERMALARARRDRARLTG